MTNQLELGAKAMTPEDMDLEQLQATWTDLEAISRYSASPRVSRLAKTAANHLGRFIDEIAT